MFNPFQRYTGSTKIVLKALLIFLCSASIGACNPMKVTDPADPGFDPDQFSFQDNFFDREAKIDVFRKLFPPGTPKEFVDRVLVKAGGAKVSQTKALSGLWHYSEPPIPGLPNGPVHNFIFNNNEKLENINFTNTEYLYPNRITTEDLYNIEYPEEN